MTDSVQAGETWHLHPQHPNRPIVCCCEDGKHAAPMTLFTPSLAIRDRIIADHERAAWAEEVQRKLLDYCRAGKRDVFSTSFADLAARYPQQEGN